MPKRHNCATRATLCHIIMICMTQHRADAVHYQWHMIDMRTSIHRLGNCRSGYDVMDSQLSSASSNLDLDLDLDSAGF